MSVTTNRYLQGNLGPVAEEVTAFDLPVKGSIPTALEGRWLRNGPNPIGDTDPATYHWFTGHGMVHGVRLRGGQAEWYRNRYVRNDALAVKLGEEPPGGPTFGGRDNAPNTSVGGWAGTTWALVEAGSRPVELTYELDTVGRSDFSGTLPGPFSAHPKFDPVSRELHAMAYAWPDWFEEMKVQYIVVDHNGTVSRTVDIAVPGMVMIHDMSLTDRYAVVYDLPVTIDLHMVEAGLPLPFRWNPDYEPRVGLLPRNGDASDIIWCSAPSCYVFHPLNAYDTDDGRVVIDLCRYERVFDNDLSGPFGDSNGTLNRWEINPLTGTVTETCISDRPQDFPRHNNAVSGRKHRYGYTSAIDTSLEGQIHGPIYKIDVQTGTVTEHDFGPGRGGAESIFITDPDGSAEDDGWLLTVVYDLGTDSSELHILDDRDLTRPAVAVVSLPQRVPFGFHGNWVSDAMVAPS